MSQLTRWNRAGLRRFRYVDGNAATYLEELRQRLKDHFGTWTALNVPPDGTDSQRQRRLLEQYTAPRAAEPDWGWEIARALARASHVLTEHVDSYANEGYLGTATQWESLRRLVAMLDYHPRPPASASTPLVLTAKPGARGKVARGFAVGYTPPEGGAPIVFETLEDLEVDSGLNLLRPEGYGRSAEPLGSLALEGRLAGLEAGQPVVLEDEPSGRLSAHVIESVRLGPESTTLQVMPPLPGEGFSRGYTRIHVKPKERLALLGPRREDARSEGTVLELKTEPVGPLSGQRLEPGEVVTLSDETTRYYRRVTAVEGRRLTLDGSVDGLVLGEAVVERPVTLPGDEVRWMGQEGPPGALAHFMRIAGNWSRLNGQLLCTRGPGGEPRGEYVAWKVEAEELPVSSLAGEREDYTFLRLVQRRGVGEPVQTPEKSGELLAPPERRNGWAVDEPLGPGGREPGLLPAGLTTAQPRSLAAGDLAVVVRGSQVSWTRLSSVAVDADARQAVLRGTWEQRGGGGEFLLADTRVFGHFQHVARVAGWDLNATALTGNRVVLSTVASGLRSGREVLVWNEGSPETPLLTRVESVDGRTLVLSASVPRGSTVGTLVIAANVVLAGHGERRPEKLLGSGDGTRAHASFVLDEPGVSFVADATRASGVRADLDVKVEGRTWTQVDRLQDSRPTDAHYMVRMNETGELVLVFGDGRTGRRLPTGANNVRVAYRIGTGLAGNVPPGSLTMPARPHPLVEAVSQPMRASGGNDMEGVEALRTSAPAAVLSLTRAVSTSDFAHLAMAHSSVWQARAFLAGGGTSRRQPVEVVVVPADGGKLGALQQLLTDYLEAHAVPSVEVRVSDYEPQPAWLSVTVEVDTRAYNPEEVVKAVRAALLEVFSLRRSALGQPLYLSDLYKTVEAVTGVESSVCELGSTADPQRLEAKSPRHVVHLAPEGLTVGFQEYTL
jgi:predicted phage baseplate assembly protein